jgi:DNA polymerase IV
MPESAEHVLSAAEKPHSALGSRKIVHVDMDAFYASVEQRDDPSLRGKPVVVAWKGKRSVVCAASYEARRYGVRSAMPAVTAERLCPEAVFIPPDFTRYRAVSQAVREIFQRHTDTIEPLSLDEAYLDVTENKLGLPTATLVAKTIRQQIREELNLTASAGIAQNKFLAKIASDWRKPNGQFVIQPHEVQAFLLPLPVGRIPGVGKVTEARMAQVEIKTVGDIYAMDMSTLEEHFGRYGARLYELARGIDHNPVVSNRVRKQISAEDTFLDDLPLEQCETHIRRLAEKVWTASGENIRGAKTVCLKLKTKQFSSLTRSLTFAVSVSSYDEFATTALTLCRRIDLGPQQLYRLVGVGLSNFQSDIEIDSPLFSGEDGPEATIVFDTNAIERGKSNEM